MGTTLVYIGPKAIFLYESLKHREGCNVASCLMAWGGGWDKILVLPLYIVRDEDSSSSDP